MSLRDILHYPNPNLRKLAAPIQTIDDGVHQLIDDMFETMYEAHGAGLAATQIDVHQQIIVVDVSSDKSQQYVFINPEIIEQSGEQYCPEGCVSIPGVYEKVHRSERIKIQALNREGNMFELDAEGLLSVCIQHEIDHLKGVLFVDHLSNLKKQRLLKKLKKMQKIAF